jgi:hypothetical protein
LYEAPPALADRCPHCATHLGVVGIARLAADADRSLNRLGRTFQELATHQPKLTIHAGTVLDPLTELLAPIADRARQA